MDEGRQMERPRVTDLGGGIGWEEEGEEEGRGGGEGMVGDGGGGADNHQSITSQTSEGGELVLRHNVCMCVCVCVCVCEENLSYAILCACVFVCVKRTCLTP